MSYLDTDYEVFDDVKKHLRQGLIDEIESSTSFALAWDIATVLGKNPSDDNRKKLNQIIETMVSNGYLSTDKVAQVLVAYHRAETKRLADKPVTDFIKHHADVFETIGYDVSYLPREIKEGLHNHLDVMGSTVKNTLEELTELLDKDMVNKILLFTRY